MHLHRQRILTPLPVAPEGVQLGPAQVVQVDGHRMELEWQGGRVWGVSALAYPYRPAVGDSVLCIAQQGLCYVIGVLRGAGKVSFTAPADIDICAPRGAIHLSAKAGVHVKSGEISLTADRLSVMARTVVETFNDVTRWVREAFQLRAGRMATTVEEDYRVQAERIVEHAEGDVKIDGKKIHLG